MIRRDYIIRMIEEFAQALARIKELKTGEQWREASGTVEEQLERLMGSGSADIARMTDTELMARIVTGEATQAVHDKTVIATTLLREAGDVAVGQERAEEARLLYLKGLNLLLGILGRGDIFEYPEFVPKVEELVAALSDGPLPLETQGRLMEHYERAGEFGRAEDALFAMLESDPKNRAIVDFGVLFYERLSGKSDAALQKGGLPREEFEAGRTDLRKRLPGA